MTALKMSVEMIRRLIRALLELRAISSTVRHGTVLGEIFEATRDASSLTNATLTRGSQRDIEAPSEIYCAIQLSFQIFHHVSIIVITPVSIVFASASPQSTSPTSSRTSADYARLSATLPARHV